MNNSALNNPMRYLPDYSAGVSVTSASEFTPPDNGVIEAIATVGRWPTVKMSVYVNDSWVALSTNYVATNDTSGVLGNFIIVNKRFKYKVEAGNITFYPFVGD